MSPDAAQGGQAVERLLIRLGLSPEKLEIWNVGTVSRVRVAVDALKRSLDNVLHGQFQRPQLAYVVRQLNFAITQLEEALAIAGWLDGHLPEPAEPEGGQG